MAKMVLKTFDEINRDRKKIRFVVSLILIPFLIVAIFLGVKVYEMYNLTQQAIDAFTQSQNEETTPEEKEKLLALADEKTKAMENGIFVDPWIASYNRGTTLVATGQYEKAIPKLEEAIKQTNEDNPSICLLYANLATANEKLGDEYDAAGDKEQAQHWYDQALLVIENAPEICSPPPPSSSSDDKEEQTPQEQGGESLQEIKDRVQGKKDGLSEETEPGDSTPGDTEEQETKPEPNPDAIEEIREQMDQSGKDRREDEASNGTQYPSNHEKPW